MASGTMCGTAPLSDSSSAPMRGGPFGVPSFGCLREGTKCTSCETNCDSSASQAFTHLFSSVAMSFSRLIYLNSISLPSLSLSPFLLQSLRLPFCLVSECSSLPACLPVCLPKLGLICAMGAFDVSTRLSFPWGREAHWGKRAGFSGAHDAVV